MKKSIVGRLQEAASISGRVREGTARSKIDKSSFYMGQAIKQAKRALALGEVPIGAVVVDGQGKIIARAYNRVETSKCQTAHAEVLAIKKACKKIGDWRLNGCWIYVTLEPCLMCMGLIQLSRLAGVVFGTRSDLFGCGISDISKLPSYAKHLKIESGIKGDECVLLLKMFFGSVRKKRKEGRETES